MVLGDAVTSKVERHIQLLEFPDLEEVVCVPNNASLSDVDRLILSKRSVTAVTLNIESPAEVEKSIQPYDQERISDDVVIDCIDFIAHASGVKLQRFTLSLLEHSDQVIAMLCRLLQAQPQLNALDLTLPTFPLGLVETFGAPVRLQALSIHWDTTADAFSSKEEKDVLQLLPKICPYIQSFELGRSQSLGAVWMDSEPIFDIKPLFQWELKSLTLESVPISAIEAIGSAPWAWSGLETLEVVAATALPLSTLDQMARRFPNLLTLKLCVSCVGEIPHKPSNSFRNLQNLDVEYWILPEFDWDRFLLASYLVAICQTDHRVIQGLSELSNEATAGWEVILKAMDMEWSARRKLSFRAECEPRRDLGLQR